MRQDEEARLKETSHYSGYQERKERKKQGSLKKSALSPQDIQDRETLLHGERLDSSTDSISVHITYENEEGKKNAILHIKTRNCIIDFCSIESYKWEASYKIKIKANNPRKRNGVTRSNFQELYETSWVRKDVSAQVQLYNNPNL